MSTSASSTPPRLLAIANVLVSQLNTALAVLGAFLITPAVLHGLGDSAYGGWLLMNSMIGYLRMLDQGTSTGTMRHGAAALAREDAAEVARVFDTSAAMFLFAGLMATLATGVMALLLPRYYGGILGVDTQPILVLGMATAIDLMVRVYPSALRTRSLFVIVDGIEIVTYSIFKLGLILYFARSLSYRTMAYIMLAESLVRNTIIITASRIYCPFVKGLRPLRADKAMFRELMLIGAALSIGMLADVVRFQLDAAVIGYFMPENPLAISTFGIGTRLPSIAFFAIGAIGAVLIPRFSGLAATGEQAGVLSLLRSGSLATDLASVFVLVNCGVLGPQFLLLWLKKPWVAESGKILLMMLPAYFIALLGGPAAGLLVARGKLRGMTTITVVEAAANFVLSVILVHPFGIYGVALGTIIPMIVVRAVLFPIVLRSDLDLRVLDYWRLHLRAIVIGLVYLALVGGMAFIPLPSYGRFLALAAASTMVFVLLLLIGVPGARDYVRRRLGGRASGSEARLEP